mgnify:CR=1 FL=1
MLPPKGNYASPLDQIIIDEEYRDASRLCTCVQKEDLQKVADLKESGSFQAWKFNESKMLSWLAKKIHNLSLHLKEIKHNVNNSAIAENYIKATDTVVPDGKVIYYLYHTTF